MALFGTLFNDIQIRRYNNEGGLVQRVAVPLAYGPSQKFLARLGQDPDLTAPAIQLPRMSFQYTNMSYDGTRKLVSNFRGSTTIDDDNNSYKTVLNPTPWNIDFELTIMAKYMEDGTKILEQILPFFRPEFTPSVKVLDSPEHYLDIPIVLNGVSFEDAYEADFQERRVLIWTLNFVMKGWYFGPTSNKKVIKFATVNEYGSMIATTPLTITTVQPGLTANGEPTTDINETIPYANISIDDNWDYIVTIEDA